MTNRIRILTEHTLAGDNHPEAVAVEFDREDLFLKKEEREAKRIREFVLAQPVMLFSCSALPGLFRFDSTVVGDAFTRVGHTETAKALELFYLKSVDRLSTMEWQHATADYKKVLTVGLSGIKAEIEESRRRHTEAAEQQFLDALTSVADTLIMWAHRCADRAAALAEETEDPADRCRLQRLQEALRRVPEAPPQTFYEAVLAMDVCFSYDPDSLGTLDRYLHPFYQADLAAGRLTAEEAKEYLQELFLTVAGFTGANGKWFTRGSESHFCIGGYLPDGRDGFCDTSRLIVESLLELPTYIPQLTFRWTEKTPHEVFRYMMDRERNDPHKRIAFTNDEKRIRAYTEICGFPFERAVNYTTVGCNEPAFLGAIAGSNSKINVARSVETLFFDRSETIRSSATFDEFYEAFEKVLFEELNRAYDYDDHYNRLRAADLNYVSSLLFNGCIGRAASLTRGGCDTVVSSPMLMGIVNVVDSVIVVRQFVFEEQAVTMDDLIAAVQHNWKGYENLHTRITKTGRFFGNDDALSNEVARRIYASFYRLLKDKTNTFGYPILIGDLFGYHPHYAWFGEMTGATPDGRCAGAPLKFGLQQSGGYDRNGLTALLHAIATVDPHGIGCGATVTNINLDEQLIRKEEYFEKTVELFETYFKNGGVHFQLNYVSREELQRAKELPDDYRSLRVRVSGYSEYFTRLDGAVQDEIIDRTQVR